MFKPTEKKLHKYKNVLKHRIRLALSKWNQSILSTYKLWYAMVSEFTGQKGSGMLKIKVNFKSQEKGNTISNKSKQMLQSFNQFSTKDGVIRRGKKCSSKILTLKSSANIWV